MQKICNTSLHNAKFCIIKYIKVGRNYKQFIKISYIWNSSTNFMTPLRFTDWSPNARSLNSWRSNYNCPNRTEVRIDSNPNWTNNQINEVRTDWNPNGTADRIPFVLLMFFSYPVILPSLSLKLFSCLHICIYRSCRFSYTHLLEPHKLRTFAR